MKNRTPDRISALWSSPRFYSHFEIFRLKPIQEDFPRPAQDEKMGL